MQSDLQISFKDYRQDEVLIRTGGWQSASPPHEPLLSRCKSLSQVGQRFVVQVHRVNVRIWVRSVLSPQRSAGRGLGRGAFELSIQVSCHAPPLPGPLLHWRGGEGVDGSVEMRSSRSGIRRSPPLSWPGAESRNRRFAQRRQIHSVQRRHPHPQSRRGKLSILHH